jgi:hypothetical protein
MPVIQSDVESHDECCIGWGHTVCPQESTSIGDPWDSKEIGILIYGISPGKGEALPGFLPLSGAISSAAARLVVDGCREHAEESSNHIQELFFPACSYIESEMLGCKIMNDSKDEMTTVPVRWVPPAKTTPGPRIKKRWSDGGWTAMATGSYHGNPWNTFQETFLKKPFYDFLCM